MKNNPVAARPAIHSGDGGLTMVTSSPFRRRTDQDRSVVVAADGVEDHVDIAHYGLERRCAIVDDIVRAELRTMSTLRAEAVPMTWAPRQRASWVAKLPTPPAAP